MSDQGTKVETNVVPPGFIQGRNGGFLKKWEPGSRGGNPSGLSTDGKYHEVRALMADNSMKAARKQIALLDDPDPRIVFLVTEAVLKRGVGAPRDHSNEKTTRVDLTALSESERMSLAQLLQKALGG